MRLAVSRRRAYTNISDAIAGEVILIGTLFSNLEEPERKAKYEKWVSLDRFPSFSELSKMLRSKDIEYRDLLEQMPEIDELISKLNKRANKYIHKQGHESFIPSLTRWFPKARSIFERI